MSSELKGGGLLEKSPSTSSQFAIRPSLNLDEIPFTSLSKSAVFVALFE